MGVFYAFICDGCGKTGGGVPGMYVHPDPPMGWIWRFGPGLAGPHACSKACWDKVCVAEDGRLILPDSHDRGEWRERRRQWDTPPAPPQAPAEPPKPLPPVAPTSWVYFAQRGESGPIKIGVSGNVKARVSALQTAVAEPVRLLASIAGGRTAEAELHERFRPHRLKGEWFNPAPELLAHIAQLNGQKDA